MYVRERERGGCTYVGMRTSYSSSVWWGGCDGGGCSMMKKGEAQEGRMSLEVCEWRDCACRSVASCVCVCGTFMYVVSGCM